MQEINFTYSELFNMIANSKRDDLQSLIEILEESCKQLSDTERAQLVSLIELIINT